jgi:transcriptional regulator with XRE-family HTH domain
VTAEQDSAPERQEAVRLGEFIRTRRRHRFSLEALARRSGISAGLLSEIERGKGNPSYFTLIKLAVALDMEPAEFFRPRSSNRDEHIVRVADHQRMSFPDGHYIEILSPRLDLPTVMWKAVYPPGTDNRSMPFTIGTETALVVLRGRITATFQGRDIFLEEGDAIRLEAGVRYGAGNLGESVAELLGASSTSPFWQGFH